MAEQPSALDRYCIKQLDASLTGAPAPVVPAKPAKPSRQAPPVVSFRRPAHDDGIEVREESLRTVDAQQMYKLRCECGRSWFELVCPTIVHCPACHKAGLVTTRPTR